MSNYEEIIKEDTALNEGFDDKFIDLAIDNYVEEYCPHYLYFEYDLYLAQREGIKGKILLLKEKGNSLMDKEWVENILEGYYPKDALWLNVVDYLESNHSDRKNEIFSDKALFGELVSSIHLNRANLEKDFNIEIQKIIVNEA